MIVTKGYSENINYLIINTIKKTVGVTYGFLVNI